MNKAKLKTYAPQARKDFIAAVTARAHLLGIAEKNGTLDIAPGEKTGDILLVAGQAWPAKVHQQRERLIKRIHKEGFAHTMEAVAYTWFNRFAALRFMEIHDYLEHSYRALSSREGGLPEILTRATEVAGALSGLNPGRVTEMKLAGNKDGELYRLLLVAQCNALSAAMPFLFERIDDETELLLPDNLLRTDSVIAKLVAEIPEEDWAEVEIIGWLYQFYISEKKDQVIGKVVKSEDIPAATQLFTPNWIVQYLVQNSVGRLWLMANPASTLKSEWPYYIEPAEQTPEVNAQLDALIQTRMAEDGGSLNPESITVLDPACGSGHILVEAYALLKGIYLERGYRLRDIPRLILEKNLYGLDIDDRAAQLAGFALLMKARADDRRLFNDPPRLNVLSLQESKGLDLDELATHLAPFGMERGTVKALLDTFEYAKTFGSLIQIPDALNAQLPALAEALGKTNETGDLYAQAAAQDLLPLVEQAQVLGRKFDAVVANPPYMGSKFYGELLKIFIDANFKLARGDLYTCFIRRNAFFVKKCGAVGMITIPNWMFLSTFEYLRSWLFGNASIETFLHNGRGVFGSDFGSCAFTFRLKEIPDYKGVYKKLFDRQGSVSSNEEINLRFKIAKPYVAANVEFGGIPGSPLAYWLSDKARALFKNKKIGDYLKSDGQILTGNNEKYLRQFWEVSSLNVGANSNWKLHHKGGDFRRWYGNVGWVVAWSDATRQYFRKDKTARIPKEELWDLEGVTWSTITASLPSFRKVKKDESFNKAAPTLISDKREDINYCLGILNSNTSTYLLAATNPTVNCLVEDVEGLPFLSGSIDKKLILENVERCISLAEKDWDFNETSWGFQKHVFIHCHKVGRLIDDFEVWSDFCEKTICEMQQIEEENNRLFINAYGLQDELSPEVPEDQITLTRADREKDSQRLISYAIGCMMGRYSLDEPGLIYAHAGNVGFDATRYQTFPADADGIVPITDEFWFEDDAAHRVREFLRAVWGADTLDENLAWLAESLGSKASEKPEATIRRYLADKFFKDHLQTYKRRPIYWLFSSGKQGAFEALVYLHRYHEGTLARMRAEYVVPLTGKIQSRIDMLDKDRDAASSTAARNKIGKQIESLKKKHVELLAYDEKLRHYADMRIQIDLDDGVKVNYGKFGDLLAEVKAVTGGAGDD